MQADIALGVEWLATPPLICKGAQLQPPRLSPNVCPGSDAPGVDKGAQLDLQTPMQVI